MNKISIAGIKISNTTISEGINELEKLIINKNKGYVCFCEANLLSESVKSLKLKAILNRAKLTFPDGIIMIILSRLTGYKNVQRIPGPTFFLETMKYGIDKNWKHFLYGGTNEVLTQLEKKLNKKFPNINIVGKYSPPFRPLSEEEEVNIKKIIENSKPDLLWVGLGGPKQEFWMKKHLNKINVPVMLGVGAAFDFHSGNKLWAPKIIRKSGFEWLFRMLTGGRKTLKRNIKCVTIAIMVGLHCIGQNIYNKFKNK